MLNPRRMAMKPTRSSTAATRVAVYTGVSADEEHQPFSPEAQAQRLAAYVRSQEGWEVVRCFSDQLSGSTLDRPSSSGP